MLVGGGAIPGSNGYPNWGVTGWSFPRQARYAARAAEELHMKGRVSGVADFLFRPFWRFIKGYIIKGGWLDGREGFIVSAGYAYYVFMRTAFLWERRRGREIT